MATTKSLIFGIGMNKTGTESLSVALSKLGIRCLHSHSQVRRARLANVDSDRPPLYLLDEKYAAFCDSPINQMFRGLDVAYPGSKFILTIRELQPWLISRVGKYGRTAEHHTQAWNSHVNAVLLYFAERKSDLLVYDLCGGEGWLPLCRFLNVAVPDSTFPWKNKTVGKKRRKAIRQLRTDSDKVD